MNETISLSESNVMTVYRKLTNREHVPEEEIRAVKQRFQELLTAQV